MPLLTKNHSTYLSVLWRVRPMRCPRDIQSSTHQPIRITVRRSVCRFNTIILLKCQKKKKLTTSLERGGGVARIFQPKQYVHVKEVGKNMWERTKNQVTSLRDMGYSISPDVARLKEKLKMHKLSGIKSLSWNWGGKNPIHWSPCKKLILTQVVLVFNNLQN